MTKDEIVKELRENPKLLLDVCLELKLYLPYENIDSIREQKSNLEEYRDGMCDALKYSMGHNDNENFKVLYKSLEDVNHDISRLGDMYGAMLEKIEYNKESECCWLPKEYTDRSLDIYEFRKEVYNTQSIYKDYELDELINKDIRSIYNEVGGQDGMYANFPIVREFNDETDGRRIYALTDCGGVAIIHDVQIVTLGEDDGNLFLKSSMIYEAFYGDKNELYDMVRLAMEKAGYGIGDVKADKPEGCNITLSKEEVGVLSGLLIDTMLNKRNDKKTYDAAFSISEKMMDAENKE